MSCDYKFPTEFPAGCIADLISMIRRGDAISDPKRLIGYAWPVVSYGVGVFVDDPSPDVIGSAPVNDDGYTYNEIADSLQAAIDNHAQASDNQPVGALPIPWAILAPLLMRLIEEALKRLGK